MSIDSVAAEHRADKPAASWAAFRRRLTTALRRLRRDQYLVLDWTGHHRYVQFAADGEGRLRCEATSAAYLLPGEEFDAGQETALLAAGWTAPTHAPDASGDALVPSGSPNFSDCEGRAGYSRAARLAVQALRDVFQVPSPEELEFEAFQGGDGIADITACLETVCRRREARAALPGERDPREEMLSAVREALHMPDLRADADGDVLLGLNGRAVYVMWLPESNLVRIGSVLLTRVERTPRVLELLDDLNDRNAWLRLSWRAGSICANVVLQAPPFDADRMRHALAHFAEATDGLTGLLLRGSFGCATDGGNAAPLRLQ